MFNPISEEQKKELVKEYVEYLKHEFQAEDTAIEEELYKYDVTIQEQRFVTYMSDDELEKAAEYAIEVLEEMKNISNAGVDKEAFEKLEQEAEAETDSDFIRMLKVFNKLASEKMVKLMAEIEFHRRVGGAYAMLITRPFLSHVIYAVYDAIVDHFDDEDLYWQSGFFIFRAIMKLNSEEICEK